MKPVAYKLDEYKIIKSDIGFLTWEVHHLFGEAQEGRCFTKGCILFIGPVENCRNGFLKGEFLVPKWDRTTYFCNRFSLHRCEPADKKPERRNRRPRHTHPTKQSDAGRCRPPFEPEIAPRVHRATFIARSSAILDSLATLAGRRSALDRLFRFRRIPSYLSKAIRALPASGIWTGKRAVCRIVPVFSSMASVFARMIDCWKKHFQRRPDK